MFTIPNTGFYGQGMSCRVFGLFHEVNDRVGIEGTVADHGSATVPTDVAVWSLADGS